jgi:hypothetical protein
MSRENLEQLYRRVLEAWNEGDIEACLALLTEDVAISSALGGVDGTYSGHEGARRWWADFHEVFPDWHAELLTLRSLGAVTLAQLRLTGHGGGSGAPVDEIMWHAMYWRDGKGWRITRHDTEAEALEAVGLSE